MSSQRAGKLLGWLGLSAILTIALPTMGFAQACGPFLSSISCGPRCHGSCPPALKYIYEGAPSIHWHRGCPHPICNPCDLPNWGYFETCWTPWPFAPNWSHCPTPPPAAYVNLNPYGNVNVPSMPPIRSAPPASQGPPLTLPPSQQQIPLDELPAPRRFN